MKIFLLIGVLILAGILSFGFARYQCWQEKKSFQNEMDSLKKDRDNMARKYEEIQADFKRFSAWRTFINLQQDLDQVEDQIDRLNFGSAAQHLDRLKSKLRSQKLEPELANHQTELIGILDQSKQALLQKNDYGARDAIVRFNRRMVEILSGTSPLQKDPAEETDQTPQTQTEPQP